MQLGESTLSEKRVLKKHYTHKMLVVDGHTSAPKNVHSSQNSNIYKYIRCIVFTVCIMCTQLNAATLMVPGVCLSFFFLCLYLTMQFNDVICQQQIANNHLNVKFVRFVLCTVSFSVVVYIAFIALSFCDAFSR